MLPDVPSDMVPDDSSLVRANPACISRDRNRRGWPGRLVSRLRIPSLLVGLLVALSGGAELIAQTDDADQLEQYLERLGLDDLRMHQLETMIDQSAAGARRVNWARRLSDLYADQLTRHLDQPERYEETQRRIQQLLDRVPESKTPSLEVMLLQADYQRAEALINQGQAAADPADSFERALAILNRIAPTLAAHDQQLWKQVEQLNRRLDEEADPRKVDQGEAELRRLQVVAGRAAYFTGWSHYYRGLLVEESASRHYRSGRDVFRRLLGLEKDTEYRELSAESLGLNSAWRARALIGLGLCEAGLHDIPASRACFVLLDSPGVPPDIRDQTRYWFFQGLIGAQRRQEALNYAREQIGSLSGNASQGKVSFGAAVLRAGARPPGSPTPLDRELITLGTEGLVKLGQSDLLRELMQRYGVASEDATDFVSLWIRGQQLREKADAGKQATDYQQALQTLMAALQARDARRDPVAVERCRLEIAWCHYQLEQFDEAARWYQQAAAGLRAAKEGDAVEAGWMALLANRRRDVSGARATAAIQESLAWLQREFPRHEYTKRAEFLVLQGDHAGGSSEEQLAALRSIPESDSNYLAARLELCRRLHQHWRQAKPDERDVARSELTETVERLLARESARLQPGRRLQLRLMLVELALADDPPDVRAADAHLQAAAPLASRQAQRDRDLVAEFHYRRLQVARLEDDTQRIQAAADWFVERGQGTHFETTGLIAGAQLLDRQWLGAASDRRPALAEQGLRIYQRLATLLGESVEQIQSSRNAQVAYSKTAQYAAELERWDIALEVLERLLEAFPKDKGYLQRAGIASFQEGVYDRSLDHWRTVLAGVATGTDDWYEAKYHQLACLLETDRAAAEQVWRQFQLLDPELGSAEWRDKFRTIQQRLGTGRR